MTIIRFGVDLAKSSFAVCGMDERGKICLQRTLHRSELLEFIAQQSPALVAMEIGSGAHYWAREFIKLGHDARLLDPRLVTPYRPQGRTGKNDHNDAIAICEAAGRPHMRFVCVKSVEQQGLLIVHRLRQATVTEHTRTINQLRGFLAEFGIVVSKSPAALKRQWLTLRQQHVNDVPGCVWQELDGLYARVGELHEQVLAYDRQLKAFVRDDARAARLAEVSGIGTVTASAIVATIGNGQGFKNGRQFAAWLGLTPRQYSTGGKTRLGRISCRGDIYLRTLLVHGARSELMRTAKRDDAKSRWAEHLKQTKSWNKTAVALANKHARIAWALLAREASYQPT